MIFRERRAHHANSQSSMNTGRVIYISHNAHRTLKTRAARTPILCAAMELHIRDVSMTYPNGVQALKDVTLTMRILATNVVEVKAGAVPLGAGS
jgi:ABC-type transport system involved in cytochrome bd biosynthesis fused ATPase/permease subunit